MAKMNDSFFEKLTQMQDQLTVVDMLRMYDEHVNIKIAMGLKKVSHAVINNFDGIGHSKQFKQLVKDEVSKSMRELRSRDLVISSTLLANGKYKSALGQVTKLSD